MPQASTRRVTSSAPTTWPTEPSTAIYSTTAASPLLTSLAQQIPQPQVSPLRVTSPASTVLRASTTAFYSTGAASPPLTLLAQFSQWPPISIRGVTSAATTLPGAP